MDGRLESPVMRSITDREVKRKKYLYETFAATRLITHERSKMTDSRALLGLRSVRFIGCDGAGKGSTAHRSFVWMRECLARSERRENDFVHS